MSSSAPTTQQILAPSEIFHKLTGSKRKKTSSSHGAKKLTTKNDNDKTSDVRAYAWNPHLEYKYTPVSNLNDAMQRIFKKKNSKRGNAGKGQKHDGESPKEQNEHANDSETRTPAEYTPEEMTQIRREHEIHLSSSVGGVASDRFTREEDLSHIPNAFLSWDELELPKSIMKAIQARKYERPSAVQMQGIPIMMKMDKDFVCVAPTGTGKTATFAISLLNRIKPSKLTHQERKGSKTDDNKHVYPFRAVVVSPTKVLATQIYEEFQHFVKGGAWKVRPLGHTKSNTTSQFNDILVATPKRLAMAIKEKLVDLSAVEYIIFDEADKLFDMGYLEHVDEIIAACTNPSIVKCMFSATMPLNVEQMVNSIMNDYVRMVVGKRNTGSSMIDQKLEFVGTEIGKLHALRDLLKRGVKVPILIFVQSKQRARELQKQLSLLMVDHVFPIDTLHSAQTNTDNMHVVHQFEEGKVWALIATDVAARGIDFKDVSTVINYDFPFDMMTYIHRIGRTGRAGHRGTSITYVTYPDIRALRAVAEVMRKSGCPVEEWMLSLDKNEEFMEKRKNFPPSRDSILKPRVRPRPAKRRNTDANGRKKRKRSDGGAEGGGSKKRSKASE